MEYDIVHYPEKHRFELKRDGMTAFVQYRLVGNNMDIIHTIVPEPLEGQGIAAALVKAAFDYALENQLKPRATCSYAVAWLKRHKEYER
ncbi:GNAT family N-acetyltransferase [Parabacteroides sp.]